MLDINKLWYSYSYCCYVTYVNNSNLGKDLTTMIKRKMYLAQNGKVPGGNPAWGSPIQLQASIK